MLNSRFQEKRTGASKPSSLFILNRLKRCMKYLKKKNIIFVMSKLDNGTTCQESEIIVRVIKNITNIVSNFIWSKCNSFLFKLNISI